MTITITPQNLALALMILTLFWVWTKRKGGRILALAVAIFAAIGVNAIVAPLVGRIVNGG